MTKFTPPPTVLFFGSFQQYSTVILDALVTSSAVRVIGVVTTPPQPASRTQELTKTDVHLYAEEQDLPVYTPETLTDQALLDLKTNLGVQPDLIVTAGYGKLLASNWLAWPRQAAVNLHFSLLPKYRGANPAEWALLMNEKITGVTLIEMSAEFDTGRMIAKSSVPISAADTRESIYHKLYQLGGEVLPEALEKYGQYAQSKAKLKVTHPQLHLLLPPQAQPKSSLPYAQRLERADGGVGWTSFKAALAGKPGQLTDFSPVVQSILKAGKFKVNAVWIERMCRALVGFPGLWTLLPTAKGSKRMKILTCHLSAGANSKLIIDEVQIEGKSPAKWNEIKNQIVEKK